MSCRTTSGGSASMRLAKAFSGLDDSKAQSLFHALKREGSKCPPPTADELEAWRERQRVLLKYAKLSDSQKAHTEKELLRAVNERIDGGVFHAWQRLEVRARQEIVMNEIASSIIDLSSPRSQSAQYELDENGRPKKVWYASYGSNLSKARFQTYIEGGTPEGSRSRHAGCRDKTLPEADIPIRFDGRLHFSGSSTRWGGGGVAFMDNADNLGRSLGRAYLITMEQFDDVAAQENGKTVGNLTAKTEEAIINGSSVISETSLYGTLVHIGDYKGAPVFTFTADFSAEDALVAFHDARSIYTAIKEPSPNYIRVIASGLSETFDLTMDQQIDYIRGSLGAEDLTRTKIREIIESPAETLVTSVSSYPLSSGENYEYGRSGYGYGNHSYRQSAFDDEYAATSWDSLTPPRDAFSHLGSRSEEQMDDNEYAEEMARFLSEPDPDVPWFNDPHFAKKVPAEDRRIEVPDDFPLKNEGMIHDAEIVYKNPKGCDHCKSKEHLTYECLVVIQHIKDTQNEEATHSTSLFRYSRLCAICQKPGHTMHECPDMYGDDSDWKLPTHGMGTMPFKPKGYVPGLRSDVKKEKKESRKLEPVRKPRATRGNPEFVEPDEAKIQQATLIIENAGIKIDSIAGYSSLFRVFGVYSPGALNASDLDDFVSEYRTASRATIRELFRPEDSYKKKIKKS